RADRHHRQAAAAAPALSAAHCHHRELHPPAAHRVSAKRREPGTNCDGRRGAGPASHQDLGRHPPAHRDDERLAARRKKRRPHALLRTRRPRLRPPHRHRRRRRGRQRAGSATVASAISYPTTAEQVLDKPWLGIGADSTPALKAERTTPPEQPEGFVIKRTTGQHAHNLFLQTWYELGVFGVILVA